MFVCFNQIDSKKTVDDSIIKFLLNAFRSSAKKSQVYGSVYKWNDKNFTNALKSIIKDRNLECHFASGTEGFLSKVDSDVKDFFKYMREGGIYDKDPNNMMNHNKFFLFEKLDFKKMLNLEPAKSCGEQPEGYKAALYLSSSNLTKYSDATDDYEKNNDAILISLTDEIYKVIKGYYLTIYYQYLFATMGSTITNIGTGVYQNLTGIDVDDIYTKVKSEQCKIYLYPRKKEDKNIKDTLVNVVKNILHYNKEVNSLCEVHIVMPGWYNNRSDLAHALAEMKRKNPNEVKINIISRFGSDNSEVYMHSEIKDILEKCANIWFQKQGTSIHSKYMLINAPYMTSDGVYSWQKLVFMGSANYSGKAIYDHWEILCKLYEETNAYDKFLDNFNYLLKEIK